MGFGRFIQSSSGQQQHPIHRTMRVVVGGSPEQPELLIREHMLPNRLLPNEDTRLDAGSRVALNVAALDAPAEQPFHISQRIACARFLSALRDAVDHRNHISPRDAINSDAGPARYELAFQTILNVT